MILERHPHGLALTTAQIAACMSAVPHPPGYVRRRLDAPEWSQGVRCVMRRMGMMLARFGVRPVVGTVMHNHAPDPHEDVYTHAAILWLVSDDCEGGALRWGEPGEGNGYMPGNGTVAIVTPRTRHWVEPVTRGECVSVVVG